MPVRHMTPPVVSAPGDTLSPGLTSFQAETREITGGWVGTMLCAAIQHLTLTPGYVSGKDQRVYGITEISFA